MPKIKYASLHNHTEFSMLDGLATITAKPDGSPGYVERAQHYGMDYLSITDHGNLCGLPEFYLACRKAGIEPILGEEFYYTTDYERHLARLKEKRAEKRSEGWDAGYVDPTDDGLGRYHFVALAIGRRGYQVLAELSTASARQFHMKPLVDRAMIEAMDQKDRDSLVILSGCAASVISKAILAGDNDRARGEIYWWREQFKHFHIELQHHDCDFDRKLNLQLLKFSNKLKLPYVVTNDPHYVLEEDCDFHDALLAIQTASDIDDPNRFRFDGTGYHLRSPKEMEKAFRGYKGVYAKGAKQSIEIAKLCHTRIPEWEKRSWHIPKYSKVPDAFAHLKKLTQQGLVERGLDKDKRYVSQAKVELAVFKEVGIADFLLITHDGIDHAKKSGIPVGPGRGSVCGTLVGYLIGLHKIDPIKYKLMFERFLNPARPKMPDIDTDFGQKRRPEMFDYVEEEYGIENVVKVCAFQRMQMRAAFQSLAGAYGVPFKDRIRISKTMKGDEEDMEDALPPEILDNYPELASQLEQIKGIKRSVSTHPAGVIIADPRDNIRDLVPEMWIASSKKMVGAYDLEAVEGMGLMKQDFLGLKTLDMIEECVDLVEDRTNVRIDPDLWVPDDEDRDDEVWKMLCKGDCDGVFQMEGATNRRGCIEVQPKNFEDVVSITALYRTGPIRAGYPKIFNANRKGKRKDIKYATRLLKPILEATWGVILYQEQVMEIGEKLAGFNSEQVDDIKEAIKHKKSKLMESMKPLFVKGCKKTNGISKEIAERIWKDIEGYSGYSYNRSHAVAYTFLTYQTARLKVLYPLDFYAAHLRTVDTSSNTGKAKKTLYLQSAIRRGYEVLPPDINISGAGASPDHERGAIRFGLQDVKGIGGPTCTKILRGRLTGPYESIEDVGLAVNNSGVLGALEACSALDSLGGKGDRAQTNELLGWDFYDELKKLRKKYKRRLILPENRKMTVCIVGQITDILHKETATGKPYVTWTLKYSSMESFRIRLWSECKSLFDLQKGSVVLVEGTWDPKWENASVGDPDDVKVIDGKYEEF